MNFKKYYRTQEELNEKVSRDCSTGGGVIPDGPYKGWSVVRTNHLDDTREPSNKERDQGFVCDTFEDIVMGFLSKRPLGIQDGKYMLEWKNRSGFQCLILNVQNEKTQLQIVTIMQLNQPKAGSYITSNRVKFVALGVINKP